MDRTFWLPNLSGKALSDDRLHEYFVDSESGTVNAIEENGFILDYRPDEKVIAIRSNDDDITALEIRILNESGLCELSYPIDGDVSADRANKAWHAFRLKLDGCFDCLYNCTAMDNPFDVFMSGTTEIQRNWELDNPVLGIARRFVNTVESVSDQLNHLWAPESTMLVKDGYYTKMSVDQIAIGRSNELYFDAFISFFGNEIEESELGSRTNEMKFRIRKAEIAFEDISKAKEEQYRYAQESANKEMLKATVVTLKKTDSVLKIAIVALAVSIISTAFELIFKIF